MSSVVISCNAAADVSAGYDHVILQKVGNYLNTEIQENYLKKKYLMAYSISLIRYDLVDIFIFCIFHWILFTKYLINI